MEIQPHPDKNEALAALPPVADIVTSTWPVDPYEMRISLSFLARAGAQLAEALQQRNAQYDALQQQFKALPALSAVARPLNGNGISHLPAAEHDAWLAELAVRDERILELESQIDQLQAEIEAAATLDVQAVADRQNAAQAAGWQAERDAAALTQHRLEADLHTGHDELEQVEQRLLVLRADLLSAAPGEQQADLLAQWQTADAISAVQQRRAARLDALAASVAALAGHSSLQTQQHEEEAERIAALQQEIAAAEAERLALQADLSEREQSLEDVQTQLEDLQLELNSFQRQVEQLKQQIAMMQGELNEALEARRNAEVQFEALNYEVDGLTTQVNGLGAQVDDLQAELQTSVSERASMEQSLLQREQEIAELRSSTLQAPVQAVRARPVLVTLDEPEALAATLARLPQPKQYAAASAVAEAVSPLLSPCVQALTDVKGIGSVYQQRLYNAGVGTYWELATLPEAEFSAILQIPDLQVTRMNIPETSANARAWAERSNTVGLLWDGDHVDDFETLEGIGRTFEKRLYEAGITTYAQLAACTPEYLAEIVNAPAILGVSYAGWIEQARRKL
ncbi:MAG: helix-hairpin-helix domain-containing protein [Caldilineales bacterium]